MKRWICDERKAGRHGSLLANFTPERWSRITTERSPEPCRACSAWWAWLATSRVWNCTSQNSSSPSTCSIQSRAGFMVLKLEVRWSMCPKPNLLPPPCGEAWAIIPG